ncbi:S8 family serine peptidase, partial [bacterium]|nr:S8 family serine peptidase [bacterium]
MRRLLVPFFLLVTVATASLAADYTTAKISPTLRFLMAIRAQHISDAQIPAEIRSAAFTTEAKVTIRFAENVNPADWDNAGLPLRKTGTGYAGAGPVYCADLKWEDISYWAEHPDILQIEAVWRPKIIPCLELSAPEVGATGVWDMLDGSGIPITGEGGIVADFDTGIDVFHPMFFQASEQRYDWIDSDGNNEFTPRTDAVDLNDNGIADWGETLNFLDGEIYDPALTFGGDGTSNADGVFQADWDWLYNDVNDDDQRQYGTEYGYDDADPGFGEKLFYCDDVNANNSLDVGEQLILLDQSKIRAVLEPNGARERGVDLIETIPDYNGHGTAVSGVLAGGEPGRSRFCGLAPDADLLMGSFQMLSFAEYLPWVRDMGCEILLYEFGGWIWNPLDGSTNEEALLDFEAGEGVLQVAPAGNLNRGYKHAQFDISSGEDLTMEFFSDSVYGDWPTLVMGTYLWREISDTLSFTLSDPYGFTLDLNGSWEPQNFGSWEAFSGFWVSPRGTAEFDFVFYGTSGEPIMDVWEITVHHPGGGTSSFEVNANLSDDQSSWHDGAEWIDYRSYDKTVTWPSTADSAFVLGSYSTRGYEQYWGVGAGSIAVGDISLFSGRGTRIDGVSLLSLAAPGNYDVYSARSVWGDPGTHAGYRQFSGTSAAGPHVAASAVLVKQAEPELTRAEIEQHLENYAIKDQFTGPDYNDTWGHGKIRVDDLVSYLDVPPTANQPVIPEIMQLSAYPNPFNATVALYLNLPQREPVSLKVFDV